MLVNTSGDWRPAVNFANILRATFLYKSVLQCFSLITVWLYNFLEKEKKAARKMLMKLTKGWPTQ
jgi:hypothetical protein